MKKNIRINFKYFKLIFSILIFLIIFLLFILDILTYPNITIKNNNNMFWWFSFWSLSYSAIVCFILFIYELIYFRKKPTKIIKIFYYFLITSAVSYGNCLFLIYNGVLIFDHSLITNNPKSLQSIIEHVIVPLLFNLYILINIKKYINNDIKILDIFLKILLPIFLMPIIYIIYSLIIYYTNGVVSYFFFDIKEIGIIKFLGYMLLIFIILFSISLIYVINLLIIAIKNKKLY